MRRVVWQADDRQVFPDDRNASGGTSAFEVRLLGPVQIVRAGREIALGGPRQRAVLASLVLESGRVVPAGRLAEEVWRGSPPPGAAKTLRSYVSRLRTLLRPDVELVGRGGGYVLSADPGVVDAVRFERLAASGQAALRRGDPAAAAGCFREALDLWRGPALVGVGEVDSLMREAVRLEELRLAAVEGRIEADIELGLHAEVTGELEGLVAEHPLRERLWRLLILALYRGERQADALAAYRRARDMLAAELGVEPGEELRRLEEAVLRQEVPAAPPPARHNLPRPASTFVGREAEVAEIVARIRGGARLVALTGPGGTGKTRLALEAAAELVPEFKAGVFWVGLAPLREAELVLETVARVLGTQDDLVSHIGDRQLLLLLDNFERLLPAATAVAELVGRCPNLYVLATSRERLRLRDEVEIQVSPLGAADAVRLFAERSGLVPDEPIARLCDALDDLPLAIELAAARTAVLSPAQILARVGRRLDLFHGTRDLDPRQQTLRATIDWSHELLDDAERRLFARLAVFAGGCSLEAAEEVAGADLDTLEALVHKSLVRHAAERFWMLETIREYALERLADNPDVATLRDRHADWFLALADQAAPRLQAADQALWLDRIEQEYPNVRQALRDEPGGAPAARLIAALRFFWVKRGYLAEGRRIVEQHLPMVPDKDVAKPMALAAASLLANMQGDWPTAIAYGERCRELALERRDERPGVEVASALGRALLAVGQEERAVALFEDAVARGAVHGGPAVVAIGLLNLGYLSLVHGDLPRAWEQLEHSVEAAVECGDGHAHARALAGLASVALEDRRDEAALALAARSLDISGPALDRDDICWALELAGVARAATAPECAALLLGAAGALREYLGQQLAGLELKQHTRALAQLPGREQAFATGRKLTLKAAVELARTPERASTPTS